MRGEERKCRSMELSEAGVTGAEEAQVGPDNREAGWWRSRVRSRLGVAGREGVGAAVSEVRVKSVRVRSV